MSDIRNFNQEFEAKVTAITKAMDDLLDHTVGKEPLLTDNHVKLTEDHIRNKAFYLNQALKDAQKRGQVPPFRVV